MAVSAEVDVDVAIEVGHGGSKKPEHQLQFRQRKVKKQHCCFMNSVCMNSFAAASNGNW